MKKLLILLCPCCFVCNAAAGAEVKSSADQASAQVAAGDCSGSIDPFAQSSDRLAYSEFGNYRFTIAATAETLEIEETKRKPRVLGEFIAIVKAIAAPAKIAGGERCQEYVQQYRRSTLKITAKDKAGNEVKSKTLIAGPAEHWYFTADVPVTKLKQLSYDDNTNSVVVKEKPASLYLGLNWQLGDVLVDSSDRSFAGNFALKAMILADRKPGKSIGAGIAYSFDFGDVFVAQVWTRGDATSGSGNLGTTDSTIGGVSFNISKGLEWFQK